MSEASAPSPRLIQELTALTPRELVQFAKRSPGWREAVLKHLANRQEKTERLLKAAERRNDEMYCQGWSEACTRLEEMAAASNGKPADLVKQIRKVRSML